MPFLDTRVTQARRLNGHTKNIRSGAHPPHSYGRLCTIDGTYHHVSAWHLHRYLAEFDYRYTTRKITDGERTVKAIRQAAGKRLHYAKAGK